MAKDETRQIEWGQMMKELVFLAIKFGLASIG